MKRLKNNAVIRSRKLTTSKAVKRYFNKITQHANDLPSLEAARNVMLSDKIAVRHNKYLTKIWHKTWFRFNNFCDELVQDYIEENHLSLDRRENYSDYRYAARFKINAHNISSIKGFDLLLTHGCYHPKNNPTGVVKDHRVSVWYGESNNIDPNIIGHLANCEYIFADENQKKGKKCSITLSCLEEEIKRFKLP